MFHAVNCEPTSTFQVPQQIIVPSPKTAICVGENKSIEIINAITHDMKQLKNDICNFTAEIRKENNTV